MGSKHAASKWFLPEVFSRCTGLQVDVKMYGDKGVCYLGFCQLDASCSHPGRGTLSGDMPTSDWPVGKSLRGIFLIDS